MTNKPLSDPLDELQRFVLRVHSGMDYDLISWVESSIGKSDGRIAVTLTEDVNEATYGNLEEFKAWAKQIITKGEGTSTWKIEVVPLSEEQS